MLARTGTASLVLQRLFRDTDMSSLAPFVASFISPPPTWLMAFSDRHTEETCLADLQFLHAQQIPECTARYTRTGGRYTVYMGRTCMDEAAARGFLSVVQFLHKHGTIGCTDSAMAGASRNGHLQVVRYLHEQVRADVSCHAWRGAAGNGHLQVLQYLHQVYVDLPIQKRSASRHAWGRDPLDVAIKKNNLEMVQWLYATRPERCARWLLLEVVAATTSGSFELVVFLYDNGDADARRILVSESARTGRLDLIQYFHSQSTGINTGGFSRSTMDDAAAGGHLEVVQFLYEHRKQGCSTRAMDQAARNGHLDIIQFFHHHRREGCTRHAMNEAARNGHLEIVQFLDIHRREGCTKYGVDSAAINGHLDVVQYIYGNRAERCKIFVQKWDVQETIQKIIANGHVDVLQYLHVQGLVTLDAKDFSLIPRGNVHMIKYMYDNCVVHAGDRRLPILTSVLTSAMFWRNGDQILDIIQCLDSLRLPGDVFVSHAMNTAARWGDLTLVQYLHAHGHAGCTTAAMDNAAGNGHLDIVQFLHENRSEGCTTEAMDKAATFGHLDIVQYLHENRTEGCTTTAMDKAAGNRHLDIVQYLHTHRAEGCTTAAMDNAAGNGHLDIVQFLHEHRTEGCTTEAMDRAASTCRLDIIQFLHENRTEGCTTSALKSAFACRRYAVAAYLIHHRTEGCGRPILTHLAEQGNLEMIHFVFPLATRAEDDCVRQALESAWARCPSSERRAMVAYLEKQLPCMCHGCAGGSE